MDAIDVPELLREELGELLKSLAACEKQLAHLHAAVIEVCQSASRIVTCPLTGLITRPEGERIVQRELARAAVSGVPVTALFLDGDHLKRFNDDDGDHRAGDEAIARMGEQVLVEARRRGRDLGIRWAGDEFVLVLPSTSADGASVVALSIQEAVRSISVRDQALSFSVGIAQTIPGDAVQNFIGTAAAYEAKLEDAIGRSSLNVTRKALSPSRM